VKISREMKMMKRRNLCGNKNNEEWKYLRKRIEWKKKMNEIAQWNENPEKKRWNVKKKEVKRMKKW